LALKALALVRQPCELTKPCLASDIDGFGYASSK